ncbi:MAG: Omp28-related outer membrane protein [Saprospiraceae bacterium]|nr:Omp28-related outer membrane protein [Bacteroidia bacterium]NNE14503.1 Omp28-related outer membrane protein [Saprospiraceae bacterium]NNL92467.1 Omp28-related outer membrane protein [Saprospiraceae bacterium]RZV53882.1 MAG: Omp28-related outer membrane protein [Flavobacteriaceae bacterium]
MKKYFFTLIIGLAFFSSCEEQPVVIPEFVVEEGNRKVMIEELTGVSCAPCFDGAAVIEDIISSFPNRVILNGIHGAFQAEPTSNSKYDFRYPDAEAMENTFFFFGKPSAAIDRVLFDDQEEVMIGDRDTWKSKVVERLAIPSPLLLTSTVTYDASSRTSALNIAVQALEDIPSAMKIYVIVNENDLIDSQLSNAFGEVTDFKHKHVMKASLSTINGDILGSDLNSGEVILKNYTYTVPDEVNGEWIPDNMEFVYFVTAVEQNDEVLQAASIHLTE